MLSIKKKRERKPTTSFFLTTDSIEIVCLTNSNIYNSVIIEQSIIS